MQGICPLYITSQAAFLIASIMAITSGIFSGFIPRSESIRLHISLVGSRIIKSPGSQAKAKAAASRKSWL